MPGGRLTRQERQQIALGLADDLSYAEIARRLDRPTSTVTREVMRNGGPTGYRAETHAMRAAYVQGASQPTRAFVVESTTGADFTPGAMQHTGRDLDVAVEGEGWIAVQLADGGEAYTRNGSLKINELGLLQTRDGPHVAGDAGPITIPAETRVQIGADGTVTGVPDTTQLTQTSPIARIKLVNPDPASLERGADGLFRVRGGGPADADAAVRLAAGALESSNVNAAGAMVEMIAVQRQFELQMKILQNAETNDRQAAQLLIAGR